LASIFKLGQKSKTTLAAESGPDASSVDSIATSHIGDVGGGGGKSSDQSSSTTTEEEDWDRMDSASDLEQQQAAKARALENSDSMLTVKGKKGLSPYLQEQQQQQQQLVVVVEQHRPTTPMMGPAASRSSIFGGSGGGSGESPQHTRSTRLSNVEENTVDDVEHGVGSKGTKRGNKRASLPAPSPPNHRNSSSGGSGNKGFKSDSVRSAPPTQSFAHDPHSITAAFKLAMTPENIKPLLENAREVNLRLNECIAELRVLLAATTITTTTPTITAKT